MNSRSDRVDDKPTEGCEGRTACRQAPKGYSRYLELVPKDRRERDNENHPVTPRADQLCSKRSWCVTSNHLTPDLDGQRVCPNKRPP